MQQVTSGDMDNLTTSGFYYTNGIDSLLNKPNNNDYNNTIYVSKNPIARRTIQFFYCINGHKAFIRYKDDNVWSAWQEVSTDIPVFYKSYTTLAELWSGLAYAITEISDCNNAPLGISLVTSNTQNIPASATMIVLTLGNSSNHKAQLCFRSTGYIFYRGYADAVWSAWKEISMT